MTGGGGTGGAHSLSHEPVRLDAQRVNEINQILARGGEMLTRDKLTKALRQANETAKYALAQSCTTDRGIAAHEAQRALEEADEYLAAGDILEAYGLFCFASGKLYDNHTHWKERFRRLYLD
jgi:hypothetical protein